MQHAGKFGAKWLKKNYARRIVIITTDKVVVLFLTLTDIGQNSEKIGKTQRKKSTQKILFEFELPNLK